MIAVGEFDLQERGVCGGRGQCIVGVNPQWAAMVSPTHPSQAFPCRANIACWDRRESVEMLNQQAAKVCEGFGTCHGITQACVAHFDESGRQDDCLADSVPLYIELRATLLDRMFVRPSLC